MTAIASFSLGQTMSSGVTVAQSTTDERPAAVEVDSTNDNVVVAATKSNGGSTSDAQVIVFDSSGSHLQTFTYTPSSPNDKWEQVVDMSMRGSSFALLIEQRDEFESLNQNYLVVKGHITSNVPSVDWAVAVTPGGSAGIFNGWQVRWSSNGAYIDICGDKYSGTEGIAAYARINATNNGSGQNAGTVLVSGVINACYAGGTVRAAVGVIADNSKLFLVTNKVRDLGLNNGLKTIGVHRIGSGGVEASFQYEGDTYDYVARSFENSGLTLLVVGNRINDGRPAPYVNLQASTSGAAASVNFETLVGDGYESTLFPFTLNSETLKSQYIDIFAVHRLTGNNVFLAAYSYNGNQPVESRRSSFFANGASWSYIIDQTHIDDPYVNYNDITYPRTSSANASGLSMTVINPSSSSTTKVVAYRTTHALYYASIDGTAPYAAKVHTNDWNCWYALTYYNGSTNKDDVRLYKYTPSGSP